MNEQDLIATIGEGYTGLGFGDPRKTEKEKRDMQNAQKAKALFKRLFDEAAKDPGPNLPTYFVIRPVFHAECRKAGIAVPDEWIAAVEWEESIGLPEYAHKIFAAYYKAHGSDFTPMEKGAWRLRCKQRKEQC